jgi:hypothetical protein
VLSAEVPNDPAGRRIAAELTALLGRLEVLEQRPLAFWLEPSRDGTPRRALLAEVATAAWQLDHARGTHPSAPGPQPSPVRERRPVRALLREARECLARVAAGAPTAPRDADGAARLDRIAALLAQLDRSGEDQM